MEPLEEALLAEAVASHRLAFLLDLRAALQAGLVRPVYLDWDWDPSKTLRQNQLLEPVRPKGTPCLQEVGLVIPDPRVAANLCRVGADESNYGEASRRFPPCTHVSECAASVGRNTNPPILPRRGSDCHGSRAIPHQDDSPNRLLTVAVATLTGYALVHPVGNSGYAAYARNGSVEHPHQLRGGQPLHESHTELGPFSIGE